MVQWVAWAPSCVYQPPLPPASHMGEVEAASECCTHRGLVLQLRNPELRGSQPFITVCKEANMPELFPEGGIIFIILDSKQICLLLWQTLSLILPALFVIQTSLKRYSRTKAVSYSAHKSWGNTINPSRTVSQLGSTHERDQICDMP